MKMSQSPRVRYIWSQEFQDVSDQLPADPGRSSLVHVLIQTLNLLETEQNSLTGDKSENHVLDPISDDIETTTESSRLASSTRAVVVPPDPSLATGFSLRKIPRCSLCRFVFLFTHQSRPTYYFNHITEYLLKDRDVEDERDHPDSDSSSSSSSSSCSRRKRLKSEYHGLEYVCPMSSTFTAAELTRPAGLSALPVSCTIRPPRILCDSDRLSSPRHLRSGHHHQLGRRAASCHAQPGKRILLCRRRSARDHAPREGGTA